MKNFKQLFVLAAMLTFGFYNTSFAQQIYAQVVVTHAGGEKVYNLELGDITGFNAFENCGSQTSYLNNQFPTWNWTDNLPGGTTVTDVEIHLSLDLAGTGASRDYLLNDVLEGTLPAIPSNNTTCTVPGDVMTRILTPANYNIGGSNTFKYNLGAHTYAIISQDVSVFPGPPLVPTMGEWTLIIFGLIIASFGVITVMRWKREQQIQPAF